MKRTPISYALLVLMFVPFLVGRFYYFHDIYTIPFVLAAVWVLTLNRKGHRGGPCGRGGIVVAERDQSGCSAWWRTRKVMNAVWGQLRMAEQVESLTLLDEEEVEGHPFQQYRTALGDFWIAEADGRESLAWLIWEINDDQTYLGNEGAIRPGDVVIDAGAHIGVFSRWALKRGAARIIAIEPSPDNITCLERNLAPEIAEGKVTVVRAGVWNEESQLTLSLHSHVTAKPTLFDTAGTTHSITVPVRPLDHMLEELGVDRVDFIKMDIEGAERQALAGAAKTIERFRPRMAICTYHLEDDPVVIPEIVLSLHSGYRIHAKEMDVNWKDLRPKVLFFN